MKKTNAARFLDKEAVHYQVLEYSVDPGALGAEHAAEETGVPLERMFKTLVAWGDHRTVVMACVPGSGQLSLKKLAALAGTKKAEMVAVGEIQGLTGYIRGGVSPLGTKKPLPVFLDESALEFEAIAVNAGKRGTLFLVDPKDLVRVLKATTGDLLR